VLDMAKIESGSGDWRNDVIDLRELIAHAVQTTSQLFNERGATVTVGLPEHLPPQFLVARYQSIFAGRWCQRQRRRRQRGFFLRDSCRSMLRG